MRLSEGKPGECFRIRNGDRTAIWKHLDGDDLTEAEEYGYTDGQIVACVRIEEDDGNIVYEYRDELKYIERLPHRFLDDSDGWERARWTNPTEMRN
jgi:hypothetical protein